MVATALLGAASVRAQPAAREHPSESVTIAANAIAPLFGAYYVETNVRLSRWLGLLVNANHFTVDSGHWATRATAAGVGLSYSFEGQALRGWYVESVVEGLVACWRHEQVPGGRSSAVVGTSIGTTAGRRFIWASGFVVDLGAGFAVIHIPGARVDGGDRQAARGSLTGLYPTGRVNVGWAL